MTGTARRRLHSWWHNFWTFIAMLLGIVDGLCFSAVLTEGIANESWRLVSAGAGAAVSGGGFGLLAVRALRIGLYTDTPGVLTARSLTITYTVALDEVSRIELYHGHSSHGGRFWAPAIHLHAADGRERVIRLWWLASAGEDTGRRWTAKVNHFIRDAQQLLAHGP
ncbi:hypothetical protein AB0H43_22245 [Hamadaea sp. NPDC050747]|uniref:hypothetical protein n=1 Tax=Hamadaea sp. NPDC050747 TaxID=3155789 RepID=UPI003410A935